MAVTRAHDACISWHVLKRNTPPPVQLSAAQRAAAAPAHSTSRSSSGDIPTAFCNRQISSTTTIKVERVPLRTARAINSRHGPARVSRRVCPGACVPARCGKTAKSARRRAGGTSDESGIRRQTKKNIEPNLSSDKARVSVAPQERAKERN